MNKKQLMSFESPREPYKADATLVWCTDDRFTLALQVFQEKMGWKNYDLIRVTGGLEDLSSENETAAGEYILEQIGRSLKIHRASQIFLMGHYTCSGREQMESNDAEDKFFAAQLFRSKKRVEKYVRENFPNTEVRLLLVDFKSIYEVSFNS